MEEARRLAASGKYREAFTTTRAFPLSDLFQRCARDRDGRHNILNVLHHMSSLAIGRPLLPWIRQAIISPAALSWTNTLRMTIGPTVGASIKARTCAIVMPCDSDLGSASRTFSPLCRPRRSHLLQLALYRDVGLHFEVVSGHYVSLRSVAQARAGGAESLIMRRAQGLPCGVESSNASSSYGGILLACGGWLRLQPPLFRQSDASSATFVPRLSNTLSPELASPMLAFDALPRGQVFLPSETRPDSILVLRNAGVVQTFVRHPLAIEQSSLP
ncbi:hypothetical protein FKP32DRAFT_1603510 [Trametes sanguinea]|nr:hypothetical protein FKP32DRAFT_1603510 [Trametes sanguinea]